MPDSWEYVRSSRPRSSLSYVLLGLQDLAGERTVLEMIHEFATNRDKNTNSVLTNSHSSVHGIQRSIVFL